MLGPTVFPHADGSLLFCLCLSFSLALLAFNLFLCAFFNSGKMGQSVGSFVFVLAYFPYLAVVGAAEGVRRLGAALPPVAFAMGIENIREHEEVSNGSRALGAALALCCAWFTWCLCSSVRLWRLSDAPL